MTDTKEVIAYVVAHLAGYVAGYVLNMFVLLPMITQMGIAHSQVGMMGTFFASTVVVQVGVFFLFVAIRNRRAANT